MSIASAMKLHRPIQHLARLVPLLALAPLASGSQSGPDRVQLVLDAAGPGGILVGVSEATGAPAPPVAKLEELRFLPIDHQGRSAIRALLPGSPRFLDDVPGASRIGLPGIGGMLYRHARAAADGTTLFGFLRVDAQGGIALVAEIPGTGPSGEDDPYLSRVAIAADGRTVLAATRFEAGGDVLQLDLVERAVVDRTPNLPPLTWREGGLAFANGFAVAASNRGLFRFELAPGAVAQRVSLGAPPPPWTSGELVTSPNGDWIATTAGASPTQAHVFVFARTGAARRVNATPAHLSGAGYLPDALGGPFLAVADDGSAAAWRVEGATREAFLGKVEAPPGQDPVRVTGDTYFIDTLDEVVVLLAAQVGRFVAVIGAAGEPGQEIIENADFFLVELDANGAPVFENFTGTSGDLQFPFESPGQLSPSAIFDLPESGGLLVWDEQSGGTGRLLRVLPDQPGVHLYLDDVKTADFALEFGDEVVLSVQRRFGGSDPRQILRFPRDLSAEPAVVTSVNADVEYLYPVLRDDGWLAFLRRPQLGPESIQRVHLLVGDLQTFAGAAGDPSEVLGLSPSGALLLSVDAGTATRFFAWPFEAAQATELAAPSLLGHFVPGH